MHKIGDLVNNDNETKGLKNNVNDNVKRSYKQVDSTAHRVMEKLGVDNTYKAFYCKVAMSLSEAQINSNLEVALSGNNPARYFTWLCKRQM